MTFVFPVWPPPRCAQKKHTLGFGVHVETAELGVRVVWPQPRCAEKKLPLGIDLYVETATRS